jgi:hypothetical protein
VTTHEKVTVSNDQSPAPAPRPATNSTSFEIAFGVALLVVGVVVALNYGDNLIDMLGGLVGFSTGALLMLALMLGTTLLAMVLPALNQPDSVAAAGQPVLRGTVRQNRALEILYSEKLRLLRAIRDLDFDYDVGKLTDAIYTEQRVYLIRQALAVLRRIESLEAEISAQQDRIAAALAAYRDE